MAEQIKIPATLAHKRLLLLVGASGTGKTTISNYLTTTYGMPRVITHTTRAPRLGEQSGVDYYFETPTTFQEHHYFECAHYDRYDYGSSWEGLQAAWQDHDWASLIVETQGAQAYCQALPDQVVLCFLTVSQPQELEQRLELRGDEPYKIAQRLRSPEFQRDLQVPRALATQAHVILNDSWPKTVQQLEQILREHH